MYSQRGDRNVNDGDMNAQVAVYLARLQQVAEADLMFQKLQEQPGLSSAESALDPRRAGSFSRTSGESRFYTFGL
jgi:hypothetical protein